ncbi:uncharacterized protein LOC106091123 isoform X3 [Stomoxys calcitrans]|uniref:uncharacterized protein LOC106091123 isoform X3 n=1 Tax=Stomoxys calcitrans TaxID=35570 RepID=UPI0027E3874E|nr:uncharacterized protein LOC106091123 isoform X3 [Stomoxys calcitrans]
MERRSSLRKSLFPKDEENAGIGCTPRFKRRISFSGKHLVREFRVEEEPKHWDNSYEISDNINIEEVDSKILFPSTNLIHNQNDKITFTSQDEPLCEANTGCLNLTKDLINTPYQNSLLCIENSVDITLIGNEAKYAKQKIRRNHSVASIDNINSFSLDDSELPELFPNMCGERTEDFMNELKFKPKKSYENVLYCRNSSTENQMRLEDDTKMIVTVYKDSEDEGNPVKHNINAKEDEKKADTIYMDETLAISKPSPGSSVAMNKENVDPADIKNIKETLNNSSCMDIDWNCNGSINTNIENESRKFQEKLNKLSMQITKDETFNGGMRIVADGDIEITESQNSTTGRDSLLNVFQTNSKKSIKLQEEMQVSPIKLPVVKPLPKLVVRKICTPLMKDQKIRPFNIYKAQQVNDETEQVNKQLEEELFSDQPSNQVVKTTDRALNSSLDFSINNTRRNSMSLESSSSLLIPSEYKTYNFKQLNDELEGGRIQLFSRTPITDKKSNEFCRSIVDLDVAKQRRTLFFEDDISTSPDNNSINSKFVDMNDYYDFNLIQVGAEPKTHIKCRFSQADDVLLDNTSFLTKARIGDETTSRNSTKRDLPTSIDINIFEEDGLKTNFGEKNVKSSTLCLDSKLKSSSSVSNGNQGSKTCSEYTEDVDKRQAIYLNSDSIMPDNNLSYNSLSRCIPASSLIHTPDVMEISCHNERDTRKTSYQKKEMDLDETQGGKSSCFLGKVCQSQEIVTKKSCPSNLFDGTTEESFVGNHVSKIGKCDSEDENVKGVVNTNINNAERKILLQKFSVDNCQTNPEYPTDQSTNVRNRKTLARLEAMEIDDVSEMFNYRENVVIDSTSVINQSIDMSKQSTKHVAECFVEDAPLTPISSKEINFDYGLYDEESSFSNEMNKISNGTKNANWLKSNSANIEEINNKNLTNLSDMSYDNESETSLHQCPTDFTKHGSKIYKGRSTILVHHDMELDESMPNTDQKKSDVDRENTISPEKEINLKKSLKNTKTNENCCTLLLHDQMDVEDFFQTSPWLGVAKPNCKSEKNAKCDCANKNCRNLIKHDMVVHGCTQTTNQDYLKSPSKGVREKHTNCLDDQFVRGNKCLQQISNAVEIHLNIVKSDKESVEVKSIYRNVQEDNYSQKDDEVALQMKDGKLLNRLGKNNETANSGRGGQLEATSMNTEKKKCIGDVQTCNFISPSNKTHDRFFKPVNVDILYDATPHKSLTEFLAYEKRTFHSTDSDEYIKEKSMSIENKSFYDELSMKRLSYSLTPVASKAKKRQTLLFSDCGIDESNCIKRCNEKASEVGLTKKQNPEYTGHKNIPSPTKNNEYSYEIVESPSNSIPEVRKATIATYIEPRIEHRGPPSHTLVHCEPDLIFEDNVVTISDVSAYFTNQLKSMENPTNVTSCTGIEETEGKNFQKHYIDLTLENIDQTKLSLVKTLSEDECELEEPKHDDRSYESKPSYGRQLNEKGENEFCVECIDLIAEPDKSSHKSYGVNEMTNKICRKCRECQVSFQNESIDNLSRSFVLQPSSELPILDIEHLKRMRSRPQIADVNKLWHRISLDRTITNIHNVSEEKADDDSFIITIGNLLKSKLRSKNRVEPKSFKEYILIKPPLAVALTALVRDNFKNWIYDCQLESRRILVLSHRKLLTFSLFVTYVEKDQFGSQIHIQSIKFEKSIVPEGKWKPIDFVLHFQFQLSLPFDLLSLCRGNAASDITYMLQEVDKICLETIELGNELQRIVIFHKAGLIRDENRTFVRKILRRRTSDEGSKMKKMIIFIKI